MKKLIVIAVMVLTAVVLCACSEYKEEQDNFANGLTNAVSGASDLKDALDEHASEVDDIFGGESSDESSGEVE